MKNMDYTLLKYKKLRQDILLLLYTKGLQVKYLKRKLDKKD